VAVREHGQDKSRHPWKREVSANESIVYQPLGLTGDVQKANSAVATKWREGLLEAKDLPLPEMLEEFGRYTDKQIVIRDPRVAQVHAGGVFTIRDVRAALEKIARTTPLSVTESADSFALDYQTNNEDQRNN
jgi:ferric-dicitrate binding protein FerR (iron transport regulator)